jgi:hypothetical protein
MRGIHSKEGQGRRQVLIADRLFQALPKGPRLAAAHAVSVPSPSGSRVPRAE